LEKKIAAHWGIVETPKAPVLVIPFTGNVGPTSSDATIKAVQVVLKGFDPAIVVDGKYGPKSAAAVKSYQKTQGIPVTGIVDKRTWEIMFKAK